MNRFFLTAVLCMAGVAWGQDITRDQYDKLRAAVASESCKANSSDLSLEIQSMLGQFQTNYYFGRAALVYLQKNKYKDLTIFDLAMHYCVELPKPLGAIDKWRYESCQTEAAKAPTPLGVNTGMRLCREKFDQ